MASNWIKVEVITPDKPEIFKLAEILNIDPDAALGKAIRFWVWADQQTIDGNADSVADNEKCNADSVTDSVTKALPEEEEEEDIKDKRNKNIMSGAEQVLPQTAEEVFISLPLADGRSYFDVTESYFAEQVGLYPGINIEQEFRNMRGWLDSNPKKRKTPKGIKRFITTWLQNSQDKPRGKKAGPAVHRDVNGISQPGTTIPSGFRG